MRIFLLIFFILVTALLFGAVGAGIESVTGYRSLGILWDVVAGVMLAPRLVSWLMQKAY